MKLEPKTARVSFCNVCSLKMVIFSKCFSRAFFIIGLCELLCMMCTLEKNSAIHICRPIEKRVLQFRMFHALDGNTFCIMTW